MEYAACKRCRQPHDTGYLRCESCRIWIRVYTRRSKRKRRAGLPVQRPKQDRRDLIRLTRGQPVPEKTARLAEMAARAERGESLFEGLA